MIVDCCLVASAADLHPILDWQQVQQLAQLEHPVCVQLPLGCVASLDHLAFAIRVEGRSVLTNGLAGRLAYRSRGTITIGREIVNRSELGQSRDLVALEERLYGIAARQFGREWLVDLARRSRPLMVERDRRLSILRAHLRTWKRGTGELDPAISEISHYLEVEGTGTWI